MINNPWLVVLFCACSLFNFAQNTDESLEVSEAEVYGMPNALLGNVIACKIRLSTSAETQDKKMLKTQIKKFCKKHLEGYQVPAKFHFDHTEQFSSRFKKQRSL